MTDRSEQIDAILAAAVELPTAGDRADYIRNACGGDVDIQHQVEELVEAYLRAGNFLESPAPSLPPTIDLGLAESVGTELGRYKMLQQIGEGGFAVVFMAEQEKPVRRPVAVKIIKPGMDSRQVIARFEAERQALAMMDHSNIAKVLDAGTTESGRLYFVMELVKGKPITEYCDEHRLGIEERLTLFSQVCDAVQHAHQKGVIHRDIKPSNVLVRTEDDKPVVKVIDFGIAKATEARLTDMTLFTDFRQLIGTPAYMSPEQAEGSLDIDTRSDVYSLGVLLYVLLSGSPPFDPRELKSKAISEMQRIIREVEPLPPSMRLNTLEADSRVTKATARGFEPERLAQRLRGELDWIALRALEKDRNRRYRSAAALADDLERYLTNQPVEARAATTSYRFRKFARRHRKLLVAITAILVALVGGIAASTWQAVRATRAEKSAIAERDAKESALREAVANARQARAVSDFLVNAFRSPSPKRDGRKITIAEVLQRAGREAEQRFADDPLTQGALLHAIGESCRGLALYEEAIALLEKAQDLRVRSLGREDPDTLRCVRDLGWAYIVAERPSKALPLFNENYRIANLRLGAKHPVTLQCEYDLAVCHLSLGSHEESLKLIEEAFALQVATLGRKHADTIESMFELARNYERASRSDEAISLYQEVIELAAGHPHPLVGLLEMQGMENLAVAYAKCGRLDEAQSLIDQSVKLFETRIGPEHRGTLHALESRAAIYAAQVNFLCNTDDMRRRDPRRALKLAQVAVEVDPQPTRALLCVGMAEYHLGQWQAAVDTLQRSCDLDAPTGGNACHWFFLAMSHWHLGQEEDARNWYDKAVVWMDNNHPKDEELFRLRAEATELLGITQAQPTADITDQPKASMETPAGK